MTSHKRTELHPDSSLFHIDNLPPPLASTAVRMRNTDVILAGITTVAIISSILSWRRQVQAEKEVEQLKKIADKTKSTKPHRPPTIESSASNGETFDNLTVQPIGTIRSVYRLCVGTPRQGLLAPSARGCIQLHKLGDASTSEAVSGLEGFSHIWIVFVFHLNTQSSFQQRRFKSKIAPPALGGKKVGIYATRSPHRANPIGMTLCQLDRIQVDGPHQVTLHVSGLDLVDGTPVLDIKPYVPVYDSVRGENGGSAPCSVPSWVDGGLKTSRKVTIDESAERQLFGILEHDPQALDFYGPHRGDNTVATTQQNMMDCIRQVLAMDVRSSFQTQKTRKGKFQAQRAQRVKRTFGVREQNDNVNDGGETEKESSQVTCTQQLDNLMIEYQVQEVGNTKRRASQHSGAEDVILVKSIKLLQKS